jgi:hypothetical protein
MVLTYIPLNKEKAHNIFIELKYNDYKYLDTIDEHFCTYILKKGKYTGSICGRKSRNIIVNNRCSQHINYLNISNTENIKKKYYVSKEIKKYCKWKNKYNNPCKRIVKEEYCCFHRNKNTNPNEIVNLNNNNNFNLLEINNKTNKLLKEKENKTLDFSKYRNMNCIEYLSMEGYNMKILSDKYITFKKLKFNFTIKDNYYYYDNNTKKDG